MGATIYAPGFSTRPARTQSAGVNRVHARYDNATTTPENIRNWSGVDYFSAKAANSFAVRRTLRMRSRHEVANNPFLFGVTNSNADDLIDTGPTLQVLTADKKYNRAVEAAWREWAAEVELTQKLRTAKLAKSVDGEGFLVLKTAESLEGPVKLYPCDVEADQVTTPAPGTLADFFVDGLILDKVTGRPVKYHVLKSHPGDWFFPDFNPLAVDVIQARHVVHWFGRFRPGQVRGIPVFTSSLDLFAELRAFRRAVLKNAQIAASLTGMLEQDPSNGVVGDEDTDAEIEAFKRVPIDHGMLTSLPPGAKLSGFDPKQPQTTYEMFQEKCLGEACRPLNYPLNLALGSSQKFNFSSAKLDHINYRNGLRVEREDCNAVVLRRLFLVWFEEAVLSGAVPLRDGIKAPPVEWHWPGFEPLDVAVDADADHERLSHGTLTYREFWARRGFDWRDVMQQQSEEKAEIDRLGLVFGDPLKQTATDSDADLDPADEGAADPPKKAAAAPVAAKKDGNGQEHDEDGKFGNGGGSKKAGDKKPEKKKAAAPEDKGGKPPAAKDAAAGKPRTAPPADSEKSARAKAAHHMVDSKIQRYAEEHNEPKFAKAVGGLSFKDNEPVDVVVGSGGVVKHGVELKTMVSNKAGKITMKRSAMERKAAWEKANKATYHTVVLDDSKVFNAKGEGKHDESKRVMYYRRGFGSFRVATMHPVKDHAELKKLMNAPAHELPAAAQPAAKKAVK